MEPQVIVIRDHDGYFERFVRWMIKEKKGEFHFKIIEVESIPYYPYGCTFEMKGDVLRLAFYSALRVGFGRLSNTEIQELIDML